ncbi:MAG: tRNA (adenosine(37)-N6)-threonylcarbamoyltransferase complex dimerization subunit type 1 TsaB [Fervidobacterium sp.]
MDTSTQRVVACYVDSEKKILVELETKEKHGLKISQIAEKMGEVDFGTLDVIGIGIGPGSLTGLRVGIAFATGLGIGKKFVQINSLKLIASNVEFYEGYIVVVRKAREGYLYGAVYQGSKFGEVVEIEKPFIDSVESIKLRIEKYEEKIFVGDGAQFFDKTLNDEYSLPSAKKLMKLTLEEVKNKRFVDLVEPLYLQKSVAELNFEKRQIEGKMGL